MNVNVLNIQGEATGRTVDLPEAVFGVKPNDHAIYLAVKQYLAHQRQGTHKAKERGEIKGSTRKLHRQKGTGSSRKGSIKNPLFRGGGRIFGPRPHKYKLKVNKKVKALAKYSALTYKVQNDNLIVVEDFSFDAPKTKQYASVLSNLGVASDKSLLVCNEVDENIALSIRNLPKAKITQLSFLNTYDVLNAKKLIISESAMKSLSK